MIKTALVSSEVGERVANLEARLDGQGEQLVAIRQSVTRLEDKVEAVRGEMHTQFRWVMGGIGGAMFAILMSILAQVFLR